MPVLHTRHVNLCVFRAYVDKIVSTDDDHFMGEIFREYK